MAIRRPFSGQLPRLAAGVAEGLYRVGNEIMADSQELIPVDTGTAKGSGRVLPPELRGDTLTVVVGYGYGDAVNPKTGEPAVGYIIPLHERTDVPHKVGRAKFLEQPALEHVSRLRGEIGLAIRRASATELGVNKGLGFFTATLIPED